MSKSRSKAMCGTMADWLEHLALKAESAGSNYH